MVRLHNPEKVSMARALVGHLKHSSARVRIKLGHHRTLMMNYFVSGLKKNMKILIVDLHTVLQIEFGNTE